MNSDSGKQRKRKSFLRFSLLTLVMLITASVILVEKPIRKLQGKRTLAAANIGSVYPRQFEWSEELAPWYVEFLPESWFEEIDRKGLTEIRLTHIFVPPPGKVPGYMKQSEKLAKNDRNLIELLPKYPDASEDVRSLVISHPLTEELEDWIASRYKLRLLEIGNHGKPLRNEFVQRIVKLKSLEVLDVPPLTSEQVEMLKTMKGLKWLRVYRTDKKQIASLREGLPNTYVH